MWFEYGFDSFVNQLKAKMAKRYIKFDETISNTSTLQAYVNHGRWLVKCECGGAEYAWEEKLFMCQSCWNANHKHEFRKIKFPKERKQIEELLSKRPIVNRNWKPNETIEDLIRENKEHEKELL